MDSGEKISSRDRFRGSLIVIGIVYAVMHALMFAGLVWNPPEDLVFVPTLPGGRVMAEFDPCAFLDKSPIEYGSARFWSALVCGIFITLPPTILLITLWSYLVHAVLVAPHGQRSFAVGCLTMPFVLLTMLLVPVMPDNVTKSLGWQGSESGPRWWFFIGPMYGPIAFVLVVDASDIRARLICTGFFALMAGFYFISVLIHHWNKKNRLAAPDPRPARFTLRTLMLAVLGTAAYASGLVLIFR